jgi:glycosyltransferase involved in cell wall biosynthesis
VRFSVVTPSFRSSAWLKLCVASVADQGVALEHLVQDAGSDDGTLDWLANDPRVQVRVEPDAGMYDAINRGLRRATGDFLAYLNCDEQYLPGALAAVARFFEAHPEVDLVFGDAVVVNAAGDYLFHRKVVPPRLAHTATCHLGVLTCATFFRRRLIEEADGFFDPSYRAVGDAEWMVRQIRRGVRMATLGGFTSVFTLTGENLSLNPRAREEGARLAATVPGWMRALRPLWMAQHRWHRWRAGGYRQEPFSYALYTLDSPAVRVVKHAPRPTARWHWDAGRR